MGYNTRYTLKTHRLNAVPDALIDILGEKPPDFEALISCSGSLKADGNYNPFEESCKWYEHEKDMKEFSVHFPEYIFELHGEGEESGDIWVKTFFRGRMHHAKAIITFVPPEPKFFK